MSSADFWTSTLQSVILIITGRQEAEQHQEREAWERTRWMAATFLQPHLKKGAKMRLQDLIEFPWERIEKPAQVEPEKIQRRQKRFSKWDEEMKKKHYGE
jgi:hypothetical protein